MLTFNGSCSHHWPRTRARVSVERAGLVIAGFEVPHTHLHVIPLRTESDVLLSNAAPMGDAELDSAIEKLREAVVDLGYVRQVPSSMTSLN